MRRRFPEMGPWSPRQSDRYARAAANKEFCRLFSSRLRVCFPPRRRCGNPGLSLPPNKAAGAQVIASGTQPALHAQLRVSFLFFGSFGDMFVFHDGMFTVLLCAVPRCAAVFTGRSLKRIDVLLHAPTGCCHT